MTHTQKHYSQFFEQHIHALHNTFNIQYCKITVSKVIFEVFEDFYEFVKAQNASFVKKNAKIKTHEDFIQKMERIETELRNSNEIIERTFPAEYLSSCFKLPLKDELFTQFYKSLLTSKKSYSFLKSLTSVYALKTENDLKEMFCKEIQRAIDAEKPRTQRVRENMSFLEYYRLSDNLIYKISEMRAEKNFVLKLFYKDEDITHEIFPEGELKSIRYIDYSPTKSLAMHTNKGAIASLNKLYFAPIITNERFENEQSKDFLKDFKLQFKNEDGFEIYSKKEERYYRVRVIFKGFNISGTTTILRHLSKDITRNIEETNRDILIKKSSEFSLKELLEKGISLSQTTKRLS